MSLVAYLLFDGHTLHILMGSLLTLAIFDIIAKVYVGCKDHEAFFFRVRASNILLSRYSTLRGVPLEGNQKLATPVILWMYIDVLITDVQI